MTGLLIIMFVPVFNSYKADPTVLTDLEKHDLETYRMKWLLGALAIVVVSLLTPRDPRSFTEVAESMARERRTLEGESPAAAHAIGHEATHV